MIVSIKDCFKLIGISIVCFCAVFVCTFFLNYYIDILPLKDSISSEIMPLYTAQLSTAKMTCSVTGGFLAVIVVIMMLFYIKLYIDNNCKTLGTFKAMGYSNYRIALSFLIFGASVLVGCSLGFGVGWAAMTSIYKDLTIDGLPDVTASFHPTLLICLVIIPTIVFSLIAYIYAFVVLRKPALLLMKGELTKTKKVKHSSKSKDRPFLLEMCFATLNSKKSLAFFVAFSAFCFSAMVQMGASMEDLMAGTMGVLILGIGIVLAVVSMLMAMTSLVKNNTKNIALMKAMGYSKKECFVTIFLVYIVFLLIGFLIGTIYQYGLLTIMINSIFKDVENVPEYTFNVKVFFITLASFIVLYALTFVYYMFKANKSSIKEIMLD